MGGVLSIIKNRFVSLLRTERIASGNGGMPPPTTTEMTGTNCTLDAARNGPKRERELLRKAKLADGNHFPHLTTHANE